ncbi:MAG: lytic transglycosylase domain-containing protein [Acidobacteriota bacterium]
MFRKSSLFCLILALIPGVILAGKIQFYVDEDGNKIFYNLPSALAVSAEVAGTTPQPAPVIPERQLRASRYDDLILKHSSTHGVDPELVKAMMGVESGYNPLARSNKDAHGLMQLIPGTARRFGVKNIYDPSENIEGGVKYVRFLIDMFKGDLNMVLASYNAGENRVLRVKGIPRIRETQDYVAKITRIYGSKQVAVASLVAEAPAQEPIFRIVRARDEQGNGIFTNRPTRELIQIASTEASGGTN